MEHIIMSTNARKKCERCKASYSERDNIGSLRCFMHTKEYDRDIGYLCCNRKFPTLRYTKFAFCTPGTVVERAPRGCTPCDCGVQHEPVNLAENPDLLQYLYAKHWKNNVYDGKLPGLDQQTSILHRQLS